MSTTQMIVGGTGGILWSLAYVMTIRLAYKEKTYGVPFVAICCNTAWEFTFSFIYPPNNVGQLLITLSWFVLDLFIVRSLLLYGKQELKHWLPERYFYPAFVLILSACLALMLTSVAEFQDHPGRYTAFFIDMLMAFLFVQMLLQRKSIRGQSIYIGMFRLIGSACYGIIYHTFYPESQFLTILYILTFIGNAIYVTLLYDAIKRAGLNPLRRW